jgi:hypothetical protein
MPSITSFIFLLLSFVFLSAPPCFAKVLINEFSPKSETEWIEIYNDSDEKVDLSNWSLVDDNSDENDDIELSGCIKSKSFRTFTNERWLNNSGDIIYLKNDQGETVDEIGYGEKGELDIPEEDESARREPDGSDNWLVDENTSKENEACQVEEPTDNPTSAPTEEPTTSPTETPTQTPTPTEKPESNVPEISITNISDNIQAGVMFNIDYEINDFESNQDYRLKARIGQQTSNMNMGQTRSSDYTWLYDNASWDSFPQITVDDQGRKSGTIVAKVKQDSPVGEYYLKISARSNASENIINSSEKEINVTAGPTPIPTNSSSPTPKPTKKPSPTLTDKKELTVTPTNKPSPDPDQSPTPSNKKNNLLSSIFNKDKPNKEENEGKVLGQSDAPKGIDKNKMISFGFIGIGGGCISAVGAWPYLQKLFATIKKDNEE